MPEDRRQHGLVMDMSIAHNIALASLGRLERLGLIFASTERSFAADWAKRLQVKYGRISSPVTLLSGGNQQKVVLAKWLARKPSLLIVDEPTRGIDIGTKAEVHRLLSELAGEGVAVLVISSELPEVLTLADRVLVMREGRLVATLPREEATEEAIVAAGTGQAIARNRLSRWERRHERGDPGHAPPAAEAATDGTLANPRSLVDFVLRARTFGIVGILALFVLVTTLIQPSFLSGSNIRFILSDAALVRAVGHRPDASWSLTRNVDLSVGSVWGSRPTRRPTCSRLTTASPIPLVFVVGIAIGLACGLVTGLIAAIGRVPSLVVTLAMLYIIRGFTTIVVGPSQVVANSLPNSFINIFHDTILGIPDLAGQAIAWSAVAAYYLRSYRSGRDLYAIGSDPDAARLAGIPIAKRVFFALRALRRDRRPRRRALGHPVQHDRRHRRHGLELQVIAAVVVGGVAIFGGSGSVVGAALGALLLQTITAALNVLGVPSLWTEAIAGFLLLVAITLDRGIQLQLGAALRKRRGRLGA